MNDRKFEIYKILFEKFLVALILGISTYTVNVMLQNYESNKEMKAEYAKRKANIAYEVAEYSTLLHRHYESLHYSSMMLLNNAPSCNDINAFQVYMAQTDSLKPQQKKIDNLTLKMHEIRFKVKLYLGDEISQSFEEYLDSIYQKKSQDYSSKLRKLSKSISSNEANCEAVIQAQKNILSPYSIGTETLKKHSNFMSKLVKLMPNVSVIKWEN